MNDKQSEEILNVLDEVCCIVFSNLSDKPKAMALINSMKIPERQKFVFDVFSKSRLKYMMPKVEKLCSELYQNEKFREILDLKIQEYADKSARTEVEKNLESKGIENSSSCTIS